MITKTLSLKHDFSQDETIDIAKEMSEQINQKHVVELNKAQTVKQFNGEIKYWDKQINKNNELITNGFEYRDTACEVRYNDPVNGQKTIIRQDTFEAWQEPMSIEEFDLFNVANIPTETELLAEWNNQDEDELKTEEE